MRDKYACYIAQHDEYKTECYCEHCGYYLGDKDSTHSAGVSKIFDEETNFCPKCGNFLYKNGHMNGDLISRSILMQSLRNNVLVDVTPNLEQAIDEQPTAYDVDKVVERLEDMKYVMMGNYGVRREVVNFEDLIEVVKSGGIN